MVQHDPARRDGCSGRIRFGDPPGQQVCIDVLDDPKGFAHEGRARRRLSRAIWSCQGDDARGTFSSHGAKLYLSVQPDKTSEPPDRMNCDHQRREIGSSSNGSWGQMKTLVIAGTHEGWAAKTPPPRAEKPGIGLVGGFSGEERFLQRGTNLGFGFALFRCTNHGVSRREEVHYICSSNVEFGALSTATAPRTTPSGTPDP